MDGLVTVDGTSWKLQTTFLLLNIHHFKQIVIDFDRHQTTPTITLASL